MNKARAREIREQLVGIRVAGLNVGKVIDTGVSAAVYEASNDAGEKVALKVIDTEFAERGRLDRELTLKGHDCPHLVKIFDGGPLKLEGDVEVLYLVMELVDGKQLTKYTEAKTPTSDADIRRLLQQLHSAGAYLLERELCHRDIKAKNVRLREDNSLVLLDLGVLRPAGESDLTRQGDAIGTRRYMPPEMQHCREEISPAGFEAITVYQIGAVLYELVQRSKLFSNVPDNPDATMSRAVDVVVPQFFGPTVGTDLCQLALRCLAKDWCKRPKMTEILTIATAVAPHPPSSIDQRRSNAAAKYAEVLDVQNEAKTHRETMGATLVSACDLATKALALPGLTLATPKGSDPGIGATVLVSATYAIDLSNAIVVPLVLALFISVESDLRVKCEGCGVFGSAFMPAAHQLPKLFRAGTHNRDAGWARTFLECVWYATFDEEAFERTAVEWATRMLDIYYEQTEHVFNSHIEYHKAIAQATLTGARISMQPIQVRELLYNTKLPPRQISTRNWAIE